MRRATMTRQQAEQLKHDLTANLEAAKRSLGAALLVEGGSALFTKVEDVSKTRKALAAAQEALGDAEAMFLALEESERQQEEQKVRRFQAHAFLAPAAPRVTLEQYMDAK